MRKFLFVALFAVASPVRADWAEVPLEVLVDEADLIVVGKITKVQDGGFFTIGPNKSDHIVKQDVAVMEISAILKAPAKFGKPKEVHIGQSGLAKITSADIRFRAGQEGIWLLSKDPGQSKVVVMKGDLLVPDPERSVYWAKHPGQFQNEKEQKKLTALIEARAKLPVGKAVNGLVARAELLEGAGDFKVRFSLKNVSEKPITACDYVGNRPLKVQWTGPDDKALKSKHYDWLALAFIGPLAQNDFVTIQPGGVRFINHGQGIAFQPPVEKQPRNVNVIQPGQHRVTVSFVQNEIGRQFNLENIWTGTVAANELTFSAK